MQIVIDGLAAGSILSLLALAFGLVYSTSRLFHLGLCAVYVISPLVTRACMAHQWNNFSAAVAGLLTGIILSWLSYLLNHRPLQNRSASAQAHFVAALGGYLCLLQAAVLIFGNESRMLRTELGATFSLAGYTLTGGQMAAMAISAMLIAAVFFVMQRTRLGVRLRAIAENSAESELHGIPVHRLEALAFAIAGFLCAASALLIAYETGIDPNSGFIACLPAIAALIVGGRNTLLGPVVGGLLVGFMRTASSWWFSASWQEAITFAMLAVFLLIRPAGLIPATREETNGR